MRRELHVETKPAPGVIATSPATNPVEAPTSENFPVNTFSTSNQDNIAAAAEMCVVTKAWTASPSAARAEPALNPNQPNQRRPAPRKTNGTLCGRYSKRL